MKRFILIGSVLLIISFLAIPGFAAEYSFGEYSFGEYSFRELMQIAGTEATIITEQIDIIDDLKTDLAIYQTNYQPQFSLTGKPLMITTDKITDELDYSVNGTFSATWQLPSGLELGSNVELKDLIDSENSEITTAVNLKYPIFPGIRNDSLRSQITKKERELMKAEWNLAEKELELEIKLWQKYYTTLILFEKNILSGEELAAAKEELDEAKNLYSSGDITESELLTNEIGYQNSVADHEKSRQNLVNGIKDLLDYAGINLADIILEDNILNEFNLESIKLADSLTDIISLSLIIPDQLPLMEELYKIALLNSKILKEIKLDLLTAQEDLQQIGYNTLPEVVSQLDCQSDANSDDYDWTISLNVNYQIGDGGKSRFETERQEKMIADLESDLLDSKVLIADQLSIKLDDLKVAYLEFQTAELEFFKKQLDHQLIEEQFKHKLISETELNSSKRLVKNKELDYLLKKIDYQVNYWELNKLVYLSLNIKEVTE